MFLAPRIVSSVIKKVLWEEFKDMFLEAFTWGLGEGVARDVVVPWVKEKVDALCEEYRDFKTWQEEKNDFQEEPDEEI